MTGRYITPQGLLSDMVLALSKPTPLDGQTDDLERFRLYRLCACGECGGAGKTQPAEMPDTCPDCGGAHFSFYAGSHRCHCGWTWKHTPAARCKACRGEGRSLDLVATCGSPEAVGVALITLGREGEWAECPVGVLDTKGAKNQKWLLSPWLPSARNVSDAGRTLARSRHSS